MEAVGDWLREVPAPVILVLLGTLVATESGLVVGVVLPGATGLLGLGFLAKQHIVALLPALLTGLCAALTGSTAAYLSGRRAGTSDWVGRLAARITRRCPSFGRATARQVGGCVVALGQWLVGARTLLPRMAGATGLSYARFAAWSVPSASAWGSGLVLACWIAGESYLYLSRWITGAGIAVLGAALLLLGITRVAAGRSTADRVLPRETGKPRPPRCGGEPFAWWLGDSGGCGVMEHNVFHSARSSFVAQYRE
jgi:membrane protein DedA with SNARE-associated domain